MKDVKIESLISINFILFFYKMYIKINYLTNDKNQSIFTLMKNEIIF
jgi:hypothetical protein